VKLLLKTTGIAIGLAAVFLLTFELWGGDFERLFSQEACTAFFRSIRGWAWAAAIGLLVADLLLPVPATGIMAALGVVYGPVAGALIGTAGSALAGLAGYGLARFGGRPLARRIASEAELDRFQRFFDRWGGLAVIASRMLPILPEVTALLAGLARMRPRRFAAALLLGTAPTAALFAWLGHASRSEPGIGMALAVVLPLLLWLVFLRFLREEPPARRG